MPDVIDFLVLQQFYNEAKEHNWQPGWSLDCVHVLFVVGRCPLSWDLVFNFPLRHAFPQHH